MWLTDTSIVTATFSLGFQVAVDYFRWAFPHVHWKPGSLYVLDS
jgi:hypothetical protein